MKINFNDVNFETSIGLSGQITNSDEPEFVFCGHSNVGKSSLINKLFNRKNLARVSQTPGKTATINFYKSGSIRFVDLPGYGYAKVAKDKKDNWNKLILDYFNSSRDFVLTFLLIDIRHEPAKEDLMMVDFFIESEIPFVIVLTKCDKLSNNQLAERYSEIKKEIPNGEDITYIKFSSLTALGVNELKNIIEESI